MNTATDTKYRTTGVSGLVIAGEPPWLKVVHEATGLDVCPHTYGRSDGTFRLVRDAKAAASRIADLAPWDHADFLDWFRSLPVMEQSALGEAIRAAFRDGRS